MKFSVQIDGVSQGDVEHDNACDAVDAVRASHLVPDVGGDFEIVVSCATSWTDSGGKVQPPGEVSRFGVHHDPIPALREAVEEAARKAEADKLEAEKRAAMRAEILAEIEAEKVSK